MCCSFVNISYFGLNFYSILSIYYTFEICKKNRFFETTSLDVLLSNYEKLVNFEYDWCRQASYYTCKISMKFPEQFWQYFVNIVHDKKVTIEITGLCQT